MEISYIAHSSVLSLVYIQSVFRICVPMLSIQMDTEQMV